MLKREFPDKEFVSVATPRRPHSSEFLKLADRTIKITEQALGRCLLPAVVHASAHGIRRPVEYDPPAQCTSGARHCHAKEKPPANAGGS
jgi:hypothetical protein